jgi:hypothetical protein
MQKIPDLLTLASPNHFPTTDEQLLVGPGDTFVGTVHEDGFAVRTNQGSRRYHAVRHGAGASMARLVPIRAHAYDPPPD